VVRGVGLGMQSIVKKACLAARMCAFRSGFYDTAVVHLTSYAPMFRDIRHADKKNKPDSKKNFNTITTKRTQLFFNFARHPVPNEKA